MTPITLVTDELTPCQPATRPAVEPTVGLDRRETGLAQLTRRRPVHRGGAVSPQPASSAPSCASGLGLALAFGLALRLALARGLSGSP
jgi:hypothetical protein